MNPTNCDATYTPALLKRFDRLTMKACSQNGLHRIEARLEIKAFTKEHGKEVCDAMFAELQRRDRKKART